jgi:molecular chaperone DnaK
MRTIGIDLGTTNSVVSYWDINEPKILINSRGSRITPSIVSFKKDGSILVGEVARNQMLLIPEHTVKESKRKMGTNHSYSIPSGVVSSQNVATQILRSLKMEAEDFLKEEVSEAVVTVPAYFTEEQRRATRQAIIDAGLIPKRILNEPTAAALAYATTAHLDGRILVYDLGGGTFDVTILTKESDDYLVNSSKGDNQLGGMDFNNLILEAIKKDLALKEGIKEVDVRLANQLEELVEKAKVELSTESETILSLPFGLGTSSVHQWQYTLTREAFNAMIAPALESTMDLVKKALKEAKLSAGDIDTVILSGGSTRVPLVKERLRELFDVEFKALINPDEVVALGAGVVVGILTSDLGKRISFNDIVPFALGVEVEAGEFYPLIASGTQVPCRVEHFFKPVQENQKRMVVHILQGDSSQASHNLSLGCFVLGSQGNTGDDFLKIAFEVDADGMLSVGAVNEATGEAQTLVILPKAQLDNEGLLHEIKGDIHQMWEALEKKDSLQPEERALLEEVRLHLESSNIRLLKRLQSVLQYFSQRNE